MPNWFTRKTKCKSKPESNPKPVTKKDKAKSFDEALARTVRDLSSSVNACNVNPSGGSGSGFAFGLHPLPRSWPLPAISHELVAGSGSGSSVSSSGSDETPDLAFYRYGEPINIQRGRSPIPDSQRRPKSCDISVSPKREFNLFCGEEEAAAAASSSQHHQTTTTTTSAIMSSENIFSNRGHPLPIMSSENIFSNRGHPLPTSPIHPRAIRVCPGSPRLRQDELKSPPHPLPLPPPSSPRSSSSRSIPSQWRKGKLLGRGTFGHVYLGFNSESGQMCAIKKVEVISDDNNSKECLRQLNQEIKLLSQLSHPNIVQYYSSELADDTLSVYLEYVSGGSIHKLLNDYGPFKEPVIRNYTRKILSGLAYLHGRNTIHRDIKGANILVDPNGEIKLADFGMAKHISGFNSVRSFKGSPFWMAPEVIMNGNGYNRAVDIWSLGCTILEMATSKPPWSEFDGVQAIFKIANSRELPDIPEHLSSDAKNFIMLCLQRDPSARPTATQLMDHPFVRDQATKSSMFRDMLSPLSDTTHRMATMDLSSNRSLSPLRDRDYGVRFPTATTNQSDGLNMRMNMSLPVSPCSSPLRQFKQHNRSCLPSPPHPSYSTGTINYGHGNYSGYNTRPSYNFDPFPDISQPKSQTPYGSPRREHHL